MKLKDMIELLIRDLSFQLPDGGDYRLIEHTELFK